MCSAVTLTMAEHAPLIGTPAHGHPKLSPHEQVVIGVVAAAMALLVYRRYKSSATAAAAAAPGGVDLSSTAAAPMGESAVPVNGALGTTPDPYAISPVAPPTPPAPQLTLLGQVGPSGKLDTITYPAGTTGLYTQSSAGTVARIANPEVRLAQGTPIYSENTY